MVMVVALWELFAMTSARLSCAPIFVLAGERLKACVLRVSLSSLHTLLVFCMFSATLRRASKMSSNTTSAPFSKAAVSAMRKLSVNPQHA